ncbi:MAG: sulfite exporter TauE/SafE family protein [Castellaniella sp.]
MVSAFILLGAVVGFAVGATGVGGGSLMTPGLIWLFGVPPTVAVGTDLLYATLSKGFAAALLALRREILWPLVGLLSLGSLPATALTVSLAHTLLGPQQLAWLVQVVLSVAIILTALFTLMRGRLFPHPRSDVQQGGHASIGRQRTLTVLTGVLIGVLVGLTSVGAGVVGMALLLLLYPQYSGLRLMSSDLVHAVLVTAVAGAGHALNGSVDYALLGALLAGAIPGTWLGVNIAVRLNERTLKQIITTVLLLVGIVSLAPTVAA